MENKSLRQAEMAKAASADQKSKMSEKSTKNRCF